MSSEDLDRSRDAWVRSVNNGDTELFSTLVTRNTVWFPWKRPGIEGREAVVDWVRSFNKKYRAEFTTEISDVRLVGTWALEEATFQFAITPRGEGKSKEVRGNCSIWWRNVDGSWLIDRYAETNDEDSDLVYEGHDLSIELVSLPRRDGGVRIRERILKPDAAVILPINSRGEIVLIRNERFAVQKTLLELPAGKLEPDEDPSIGAARELREETGYEAGTLTPLTSFFPSPGSNSYKLHGFVATDLTHVGQDLDDTEKIEVDEMTWDQALARVRDGGIEDAKTISLLLYYDRFIRS